MRLNDILTSLLIEYGLFEGGAPGNWFLNDRQIIWVDDDKISIYPPVKNRTGHSLFVLEAAHPKFFDNLENLLKSHRNLGVYQYEETSFRRQ